MKKLIIISDSHGNLSAIEKLLPIMKESDYVIHLGDHYDDIKPFFREIEDKVYFVKGNCDGGGEDLIFQIEKVKIMLTHGDRYGVKYSLYKLYLQAKSQGVNVVFYGHTHRADVAENDGIKLINPGCLTAYGDKSYCYAVINENKITASIVYLR